MGLREKDKENTFLKWQEEIISKTFQKSQNVEGKCGADDLLVVAEEVERPEGARPCASEVPPWVPRRRTFTTNERWKVRHRGTFFLFD